MSELSENFLPEFPNLLRQILWARGFRDPELAYQYLYPKLQDIEVPHGQLKDLEIAVQILLEAREKKQKILIFGDYDVDGSTSTALLTRTFADFGWNVDWFIPHRVNEGYGISLKAVEKLKQTTPDFSVLISCDCGISSHEGIEALKDWGKRVIVTDHHECPLKRVPADAVINPKQRDCSYPQKHLAGVGVAFLLVMALRRALNAKDYSLKSHLELVAIGSVCDVAELRLNNRIFVKAGLQYLRDSSFPGIRALLQSAGKNIQELTSRDLGFVVGPRLNAAGRIGDPSLGLKLLLSSKETAESFAKELELQNQRRRQIQDESVQQALELVEESTSEDISVVFDSSFHLGVVGLVASRLADKYKRPFCVLGPLVDEHALADFSTPDSIWKASLRAPKGYHLAKILQAIDREFPGLLLSFGGHAQAAGLAVLESDLLKFQKIFSEAVRQRDVGGSDYEKDLLLNDPAGIDSVIDWMEPLGHANEAPLLEIRSYKIQRVQVMKSEHIKIFGSWKGQNWPILQFRSPWVNISSGLRGAELDFVGELSQNRWMGQKKLEFILKEVLECKQLGKIDGIDRKTDEVSNRPSL